jgi:hypothetical protein
MLRHDIDGILAWLTEEDEAAGKSALVLDYEGTTQYTVYKLYAQGTRVNGRCFGTLAATLQVFINRIPGQ